MNTECDDRKVRHPEGTTLRANTHSGGERLLLFGSKGQFFRAVSFAKMPESKQGVNFVFPSLVLFTSQHGEPVSLLRPVQAAISRLCAVKGGDTASAHIAQLDTVPDLVRRVDCPRKPVARLVECEVGDAAQA